jgi:hypothetical protein
MVVVGLLVTGHWLGWWVAEIFCDVGELGGGAGGEDAEVKGGTLGGEEGGVILDGLGEGLADFFEGGDEADGLEFTAEAELC